MGAKGIRLCWEVPTTYCERLESLAGTGGYHSLLMCPRERSTLFSICTAFYSCLDHCFHFSLLRWASSPLRQYTHTDTDTQTDFGPKTDGPTDRQTHRRTLQQTRALKQFRKALVRSKELILAANTGSHPHA